MLERVLYSHCVWLSAGLVNAEQGGERQKQVRAGQQDLGSSCTSIRSRVGGCEQERRERDTHTHTDYRILTLLADSHALTQPALLFFSLSNFFPVMSPLCHMTTRDSSQKKNLSGSPSEMFRPRKNGYLKYYILLFI